MIRVKQEKLAPELDTARSKLDGALQFLVEKAEESTSSSEESDVASPAHNYKEDPPAKKPYRKTQRKRKIKEEPSNKNSYILKLFDRSVDLAQFPENTSLYPVCRAWIRNKPYSNIPAVRSRSPTPPPDEIDVEDDDDDTAPDEEQIISKNIYDLPLPTPRKKDDKKRSKRDPRIPSPIPHTMEEFVIKSEEDPDIPTRESLLSNHMIHWRAVRQKWKEVSALNEERYKESADLLKKMFEQAMGKDEAQAANVAAQWSK